MAKSPRLSASLALGQNIENRYVRYSRSFRCSRTLISRLICLYNWWTFKLDRLGNRGMIMILHEQMHYIFDERIWRLRLFVFNVTALVTNASRRDRKMCDRFTVTFLQEQNYFRRWIHFTAMVKHYIMFVLGMVFF